MALRSWTKAIALLACSACSATTGANPSQDEALTASEGVDVVVEPTDDGAALLSAIRGATTSVHVTMYLLSDYEVIAALIAIHRAGIDVKVVLNEQFLLAGETNQYSFSKLKAAGISVVWAPSTFTFTHEKCIVIDGKTAWIMTMNASKTALSQNREFLGIDTAPADVAEAEAQFAADFAGHPYAPNGPLLVSPVTMRPGLIALLDGASTTIDFEVEEMSDPQMAATLCVATSRHVTVRGALSSETPSSSARAAIATMKACGVTLVTVVTPYIHAKAIVADGTRVYIGSANFSANSLDHNRELGLVTASTSVVTKVRATVAGDIASGTAL